MRTVPAIVVAIVGLSGLASCGTDGGQAVAAVVASAPPGAVDGVTRTELARGVVKGGGPAEIKPGLETVIQRLVLEPGASVGWHGHSDGGMVIITKGSVASYGLDDAPCKPAVLSAGQALFVPPHPRYPHLARNEGTETAEATFYYFNVPIGQKVGHPAEEPHECPADLK